MAFEEGSGIIQKIIDDLYDNVVMVTMKRKEQLESVDIDNEVKRIINERHITIKDGKEYVTFFDTGKIKDEVINSHMGYIKLIYPYPEIFHPAYFVPVPTAEVMIQDSPCSCKLIRNHLGTRELFIGLCDYHFEIISRKKEFQLSYLNSIPKRTIYGLIEMRHITDQMFSQPNISRLAPHTYNRITL